METSGLSGNVVTQPTELMITCSSTETESGAAGDNVQDTIAHQVAALTEQYHFIDQNGRTISYEIQALSDSSPQMMILTTDSENGQVFHVIPSSQAGTAQLIIPQGQLQTSADSVEHSGEETTANTASAVPENASSFIIQSNATLTVSKKSLNPNSVEMFQKPLQPLPPNIPVWARRLRSCERIGDSYRGYCMSEAELMSILGLHKQQTQSVWGTRQSPSPAKPATRLMWKSQYVPYDGIPFVNAGSRAIVMECQYGPRRKGVQPRRAVENDNAMYKATCPARIYIKKVKKFPHYRVPTDPKIDKKLIRIEQEKAFNLLKKDLDGTDGVLRWYVQLPDQDAHQYHNLDAACFSPTPPPFQTPLEEEEEVLSEESPSKPSRLHPRVADKIRELVSRGFEEVYSVRKQLRKFVERELFKPDDVPERHNLSYFPTVNDLKNHIHEAQKSLGNGELIYDPESISGALQWTSENGNVLNEMVTVTFSSPASEEQEALVKAEHPPTEDMCPDTAQLLSSLTSLQPKIFAQLQELQLQPAFTSSDGTTAVITVNPPALGSSACLLSPGGSGQPLMLSHIPSQQSDTPGPTIATLPTPAHNLVGMGQLVTVEEAPGINGEVHQILLGEIHPIPIRIVENQPTLVEVNPVHTYGTEQMEQLEEETVAEQLPALEAKTTDCHDPD